MKIVENIILVPARSGSSRLKDKNIKIFRGKPLFAHVLETAVRSKSGVVYFSTDSEKYSNIALKYNVIVPFIRPKYLSNSTSPSIWVILHFLKWHYKKNKFFPTFLTFCPPTNPFLDCKTIQKMLEIIKKRKNINSIVTYTKPKTHPFKIIGIDSSGKLRNNIVSIGNKTINDFERSQDFPICFEGSPACRITKTSFFYDLLKKHKNIRNVDYNKTYDYENCIGYEISNLESSDIDTSTDFDRLNKD